MYILLGACRVGSDEAIEVFVLILELLNNDNAAG